MSHSMLLTRYDDFAIAYGSLQTNILAMAKVAMEASTKIPGSDVQMIDSEVTTCYANIQLASVTLKQLNTDLVRYAEQALHDGSLLVPRDFKLAQSTATAPIEELATANASLKDQLTAAESRVKEVEAEKASLASQPQEDLDDIRRFWEQQGKFQEQNAAKQAKTIRQLRRELAAEQEEINRLQAQHPNE